MRKWPAIGFLVLGATFLGATVFSGSIATAAQSVSATIIGPLDGGGNVKVHEQGTANVNVVGNASVQAGIPATQFSAFTDAGSRLLSGPDPGGTHYAITSVTFNSHSNTGAFDLVFAEYGSTNDCQSFGQPPDSSIGPQAFVSPNETISMTFPQPFVIESRPGEAACLFTNGQSGILITVVGYRF
jgi:hypothetical protein